MHPADETFATKSEAEQWLVRKEAEILAGEWIDPDAGRVLLSVYATKWLAERPKMRASTRARCEPLIRLHISPYLGDKPINEVRPVHIRTWYKQLADNGVGAATIAHAYQLLKSSSTQLSRTTKRSSETRAVSRAREPTTQRSGPCSA